VAAGWLMSERTSWTVEHFSQANPAGEGQGDVPALLRRVADSIDALGEIEVQDLVLHTHTDFDTAAGFDVQFLLGAGAGTTLTDLIGHGHADIARELLAYPELHEICRPGPPSAEATSTDTAEPPHARQPIHAQTRSARQTPPRCRCGCRRCLPLAHLPARRRMHVTTSWSGMVVEIS
jgi:hypothetical protein